MRDEYCSPWQVVKFNGQLLMVGTVAGCFIYSRGEVGVCLCRRQVAVFLLSCLIFRTDNTS